MVAPRSLMAYCAALNDPAIEQVDVSDELLQCRKPYVWALHWIKNPVHWMNLSLSKASQQL